MVYKSKITVIGLGPGSPELCSQQALDLIKNVKHVFARTQKHPSSVLLGEDTIYLDHYYESSNSFDDVYSSIVKDLVEAAKKHASILYVVPGSPLVAERTVQMLLKEAEIEVVVIPGISFLDLAWLHLGIDPMERGVRVVDAFQFANEAVGDRGPFLVAQIYSLDILAEVVATLHTAPSQQVTVLQRLGLRDQRVLEMNWNELLEKVEPDHLTCLFIPLLEVPVALEIQKFVDLVSTLRVQCSWDAEQTHSSLTSHLLEETYEVLEAIENFDEVSGEGSESIEEELGDLLFQVIFHSRIAADDARFDFTDVVKGIHDKLVRRHPNIFDASWEEADEQNPASVIDRWEKIKRKEKRRSSVLDGVPPALPALSSAEKVLRRGSSVGLPYEAKNTVTGKTLITREDLGDALLSLVSWSIQNKFEPESALRSAISKYIMNVRDIESLAEERGINLVDCDQKTRKDFIAQVVKKNSKT